MTAAALYSHMAARLDLPVATVREYFRELATLMARELRRNHEFVLPGVVKLVMQPRKARIGRNPATGETVKLPAAAVIKARPDARMKDALARPIARRGKTGKPRAIAIGSGARDREPGPALLEDKSTNAEVVRVFYGTDRKPAASEGRFTTRRGNGLSVGWCDVSIPPDHRLAVIERPRITRLEFHEDPERHFVIIARALQSPQEFWASIKSLDKSSALLFIHGFNVVFDDAVYRAAQLAADLEFDGVAMLYSWASCGSLFRYTADLNSNEFTIQPLKRFLVDIATQSGIRNVHVIAHSMGNRALVHALSELADKWRADGLPRIENLFLAAPDIDKGTFLELAAAMATTAGRTTLYASSKDRALKEARRRQVYPRAGDADEIVVLPGIDSIDASDLETDFLSHSYYGDHRSVVSDLHELLQYGAPPGKRFGMRGVPTTAPRYWKFRA
jgi:esterase/lipase superfamily enzyme/nucleoid DNA-binding protein